MARNNDDIETRRDVIAAEDLSYKSFGAISLNRAAELFCCRDAQPPGDQLVGPNKVCAVAPVDSCASFINLLKLGMPQNPLARAEPRQIIRC